VRSLAAIKACHNGPGVFNDFEFLFDPVARSRCTTSMLCAYEAKFQSIFHLCGASTLRCVRLFTTSVVKRLTPHLIKFPESIAGFEQCARAFEARSGIPGIIGAIDGSHIRVAPPKRDQKSYYNRKSFYSVILSAVCDARGAFLCCDVGFPGRMSDSKVLK